VALAASSLACPLLGPALAVTTVMSNTTYSRGGALVCSLALAGCFGTKAPPKSTTTTRTQTTTEQDTGQSSTSDVVETNTKQADGTEDVVRTTTTKESRPAPTP
jgi:hypothetical protein